MCRLAATCTPSARHMDLHMCTHTFTKQQVHSECWVVPGFSLSLHPPTPTPLSPSLTLLPLEKKNKIYFWTTVHYFCFCCGSLTQPPAGLKKLEKEMLEHYYFIAATSNLLQTDSSIGCLHGVIKQCAAPARMLCSLIAAPHKGETIIVSLNLQAYFLKPISLLWQASRPDAFPHPHRLPAEGSRLGTNRPCSQVSASPSWHTVASDPCREHVVSTKHLTPPAEKLRDMNSSRTCDQPQAIHFPPYSSLCHNPGHHR